MARPPALTTEIGYINPSVTDPASWIPGSVPSSGDATSHSCSIDTPDGAIPNESTNRATPAFFMSQRAARTIRFLVAAPREVSRGRDTRFSSGGTS